MNRMRLGGLVLSLLSLLGYVFGIVAPYPGRSFSITALMVGITLVAIGGNEA